VDRFGARLPLIVGPAVVAAGFLLLSLPGTGGTYWSTFFPPMLVLGFGLAITVAPLTTTVLNSVAQHQTGVASGINNAVAQVASLLLIAILGTVGIATLNRSLDQHIQSGQASVDVHKIADMARRGFVMPAMPAGTSEQTQRAAHTVIADSFLDTIRHVMLLGAALSLASAAAAALTIRTSPASRESPSKG
jgi:protein-S-isoprenylcysteine O-methyltransferase Ste14